MTVDPDEQSMEAPREGSLRVLSRRTPTTTGWQAADTVRRTAIRRRRTKWGTGAAAVLAVAVATAVSLGGSSPRGQVARPLEGHIQSIAGPHGAIQLVANTAPIDTAGAATVDAVVAAEQRLSLALLHQVGNGSNVTVSPISLYLALGMLQNGARGQTADEISTALQADGLSTAEQNAGLAALTHDLAAAADKDGVQLDSANSLWQQRGFDLEPEFLRTLSAYYDAGVWQVDYVRHMSDALAAIDAWTSDQTHGKIPKLFDDLDPLTVLVLANAVYFHADWQTPFDEGQTKPGQFTTSDGTPVVADFMHGGREVRAAVTDNYRAVQIPYRGGRFAALAVMPTNGDLRDFVDGLDPAAIDGITANLQSGLSVAIPRFTTTSTTDLKPVLTALGMTSAFDDRADLSGISRTSTYVNQIIQRDYLQVGELGTTAAAVTGGGISVQSLTVTDVALDHPFLFLIRDTETGAILFASEITDPTS